MDVQAIFGLVVPPAVEQSEDFQLALAFFDVGQSNFQLSF